MNRRAVLVGKVGCLTLAVYLVDQTTTRIRCENTEQSTIH